MGSAGYCGDVASRFGAAGGADEGALFQGGERPSSRPRSGSVHGERPRSRPRSDSVRRGRPHPHTGPNFSGRGGKASMAQPGGDEEGLKMPACPEGIDPGWFAGLPLNVQEELRTQLRGRTGQVNGGELIGGPPSSLAPIRHSLSEKMTSDQLESEGTVVASKATEASENLEDSSNNKSDELADLAESPSSDLESPRPIDFDNPKHWKGIESDEDVVLTDSDEDDEE